MGFKIESPPDVDTFYLPTQDDLGKLKVGDVVKFIFSEEGKMTERMWAVIMGIDGNMLICKLDNAPMGIDIKLLQIFTSSKNNVIEIWAD